MTQPVINDTLNQSSMSRRCRLTVAHLPIIQRIQEYTHHILINPSVIQPPKRARSRIAQSLQSEISTFSSPPTSRAAAGMGEVEAQFAKAVWLVRNGPKKDSSNTTKCAHWAIVLLAKPAVESFRALSPLRPKTTSLTNQTFDRATCPYSRVIGCTSRKAGMHARAHPHCRPSVPCPPDVDN